MRKAESEIPTETIKGVWVGRNCIAISRRAQDKVLQLSLRKRVRLVLEVESAAESQGRLPKGAMILIMPQSGAAETPKTAEGQKKG